MVTQAHNSMMIFKDTPGFYCSVSDADADADADAEADVLANAGRRSQLIAISKMLPTVEYEFNA